MPDYELKNGAEKIVVNTLCIENKKEIEKISKSFGSQAIIASIDYKKIDNNYYVVKNGDKILSLDPIKHAKNLVESGIGEIFLNSVDRDGLKIGYDLNFLKEFSEKIKIPIIGCGGAGEWEDMYKLSSKQIAMGLRLQTFFIISNIVFILLKNI